MKWLIALIVLLILFLPYKLPQTDARSVSKIVVPVSGQ